MLSADRFFWEHEDKHHSFFLLSSGNSQIICKVFRRPGTMCPHVTSRKLLHSFCLQEMPEDQNSFFLLFLLLIFLEKKNQQQQESVMATFQIISLSRRATTRSEDGLQTSCKMKVKNLPKKSTYMQRMVTRMERITRHGRSMQRLLAPDI